MVAVRAALGPNLSHAQVALPLSKRVLGLGQIGVDEPKQAGAGFIEQAIRQVRVNHAARQQQRANHGAKDQCRILVAIDVIADLIEPLIRRLVGDWAGLPPPTQLGRDGGKHAPLRRLGL